MRASTRFGYHWNYLSLPIEQIYFAHPIYRMLNALLLPGDNEHEQEMGNKK